MQLFDHHVHTRYSACCHERYDLRAIATTHDRLGFPYSCVSDHVHGGADGAFVAEHQRVRAELAAGGFAKPVYIGIEASIVDLEGHLALGGVNGKPDYVLCADHWIGDTGITMDDLQGGARLVRKMHGTDPQALKALYGDVAGMYVNAITRNDVDILAHPFDTFMRVSDFDKALIEVFGRVCEACQARRVAIEINNQSVKRAVDVFSRVEPLHADCLPALEFYTRLFKVALGHDVLFSTGSDAHVASDIGDLGRSRRFIEQLGIPQGRVFLLDNRPGPNG
nr:PHP domain-containing protein [Candidatus Sigynarchaeum springense]